ncbi:hypothetical protein [Arthrobacter sp. AZCC_0090]|uniref:hypothetical protein n=1 Tax=Arthrobacter sp. AZCC_0090 TaxID=2735881 RepID=UPI00161FD9AE|nr:hypothetical protein [Arthrobacter sp. AZCC_0090]MBB6404728.1 hypothetical protein [Arthrobacter sp. AZCC_0090]
MSRLMVHVGDVHGFRTLNNWEQFWVASQANACEWKAARHVDFDNSDGAIDVELLDRAVAVGAVPPSEARPESVPGALSGFAARLP